MSPWPFPMRHETVAPKAAKVLANPHTPEELEAAILAQGRLVEHHHLCGRMQPARDAARVVLQLNLMRTPETVAALERSRGLA